MEKYKIIYYKMGKNEMIFDTKKVLKVLGYTNKDIEKALYFVDYLKLWDKEMETCDLVSKCIKIISFCAEIKK